MKTVFHIVLIYCFSQQVNYVFSQEWHSLKAYQKETGEKVLKDGCWLKNDRKKQNGVWHQANIYNLMQADGHIKYTSISQIRDFYLWFDQEIGKQGHDIKWFGIVGTVSAQLSKLDKDFIRIFIVRNKQVVEYANEGSKNVFAFAFPQLKAVYFSDKRIKGKEAEKWDQNYGMQEQCTIMEPLYKTLHPKIIRKLSRMAKGKGIYAFGLAKEIRYKGSIEDCHTRFEYGIKIIYPYYQKKEGDI